MTKLATRPARRIATVKTVSGARTRTHTGGFGYQYDPKSELFNLAASNMVSEQTFHEDAVQRDERFAGLIHDVVQTDPDWVARFAGYLRNEMFMRSASIIMAAEYVAAGGENGRSVVSSVLQRADEPAEMLGYWHSVYGRALPAAIKRGVADAVTRLYTERNALKWDGGNRPWRFADVIELTHPKPRGDWQSTLFEYLLDKRHHDNEELGLGCGLGTIESDIFLRSAPEGLRRNAIRGIGDATLAQAWRDADWSWERLSGWLPGGMDAEAWEAVIPNMGYMALLRNLRNFDEAGVSDEVAAHVAAKLADPEEILRAKQFPFRIYSAFKEIGSLRWAPALETALNNALDNVPRFDGSTLILVDLSPSMGPAYGGYLSKNSKRTRFEMATIFGVALAKRAADADVVFYSAPNELVNHVIRQPLLRSVETAEQWMRDDRFGGTETFRALSDHYRPGKHNRVVILTDEQAHDAGHYNLPDVPIYSFNLAGYAPAHLAHGTGKLHSFAGLNDTAFRLLPVLEGRKDGEWPF
jgi:hypothetical protein